MQPNHFFEDAARSCGYHNIAGLDEAGRGPLAGPVVASAIILPRRFRLDGLDDSKVLTETQREYLYHELTRRVTSWAVGLATEKEIDQFNILQATRLAFARAISSLPHPPDYLLIDAVTLPDIPIPQRSIIKGDLLSPSISAASILAKVTRDRLMTQYHQRFPDYQFDIHKGYPTPDHLRRLTLHGPCDAHRYSFRPVRDTQSVASA